MKKLNLALIAKNSLCTVLILVTVLYKKITLCFEKVGRIRTEVEGKYRSSVLMHDRSAASIE